MKSTPVELSRKEESQSRGGLDFAAAMTSPCASCDSSPCCSHLPLPGFRVENLMQLDHARWLLGFAGIELGITAAGDWSVFYAASCRFLDAVDGRCTVHGTPDQPGICQHYNPYTCWYRRALGEEPAADYVRLDAARLDRLLPHLLFDDERNLIGVPTWDAVHQLIAGTRMPSVVAVAPVPALPAVNDWHQIAIGRKEEAASPVRSFEQLGDPCDGCSAHCCTSLQFFVDPPSSASGVDYFRFALGFPGVELGIADDGWSLIVHTACRHLDGNRCSIYNDPSRPLRCQYFDSAHCPYPTLLGTPRPTGFVRVDLDRFRSFESCLAFDDVGNLMELPDAETVRDAVEEDWRKEDALAPSAP